MKILFLAATLFLASYTITAAQSTPSTVSNFKILIESTPDEIVLTCSEGCAFKQVRFPAKANQPQAVDYLGLSTREGNLPSTSFNPDYFHFTIEKTSEGISLKGLKGTAWLDLAFSCVGNCKQYVDEAGMAEGE